MRTATLLPLIAMALISGFAATPGHTQDPPTE